MDNTAAATEPALYGGLRVAGMELALPLAALREVLPCRQLAPLPCALPALRGALPVRGVMVPVLDLARLLPQPPEGGADGGCVVLVAHEGRLLGLLAQDVTGIFEAAPGSRHDARANGAMAGFSAFAGSVRRKDGDRLQHLLSLPALAALPGVPWIDDPEPARQHGASLRQATDASGARSTLVPLMLLRNGRVSLAIDAMLVHATVWAPALKPSPLAHGACLGVIEFHGRSVPALDLGAFAGLEPLPAGQPRQALVVKRPEGLVALLVEQVADIVRVPADHVAAVPRFALRRPDMIRGVLAAESLTQVQVVGRETRLQDYLVLESRALLDAPELQALASSNGGSAAAANGADPRRSGTGGPALITFRLPAEMAVPIADVAEILPYGTRDAMFGQGQVLRRIQVLRGRTIPVLCLARLLGGTVERVDASAAVLVTACEGQWVGFGVPHLQSIESLAWDARLPTLAGAAEGDELATLLATPRVVTVGQGERQRTMRCLDLRALAAALLRGGALRMAA